MKASLHCLALENHSTSTCVPAQNRTNFQCSYLCDPACGRSLSIALPQRTTPDPHAFVFKTIPIANGIRCVIRAQENTFLNKNLNRNELSNFQSSRGKKPMLFSIGKLKRNDLWSLQSSSDKKPMLFSKKIFIEMSCGASRVPEAKSLCFFIRNLNGNEPWSFQSSRSKNQCFFQ